MCGAILVKRNESKVRMCVEDLNGIEEQSVKENNDEYAYHIPNPVHNLGTPR